MPLSDLLVSAFITLFVVIDPIGLAPIFFGLTPGASEAHRRRMAIKGTAIAAIVLVFFVWLGSQILQVLGITLAAFQIAGGALLFLLAIDMLFVRHSGIRSTTSEEQQEAERSSDIAVFPLAIPLIAGPGAFTSLLLMLSDAREPLAVAGIIAVLAAVLLITLASLLAAGRIMRALGETGANVFTRLLGVLLASLAVQFILDGVRAAWA